MHSMAHSGGGQHQSCCSATVKRALEQAVSRSRKRHISALRQVVDKNQMMRVPSVLQGHIVEHWEMVTDESTSQCYLPFRVVTPADKTGQALPCVILLHPTGGDSNYHVGWESRFLSRGYMTVTMDCRYHGRRQDSSLSYQQSLVQAYLNKDSAEKPFLLDNIWDLQHILDYLETRHDVNMDRIGITGMSLGGMISWLLACLDDRIYCCVPLCGVQSFGYAIEHDCYHDRVMSIPDVFRAAAKTESNGLGFPYNVSKETVQTVWDILLPGMLESYDAEKSLAAIAPRPLLIVTGANDPRNPIQGVEIAYNQARQVYEDCGSGNMIALYAQEGVGHEFTNQMMAHIDSWMDTHLLHS